MWDVGCGMWDVIYGSDRVRGASKRRRARGSAGGRRAGKRGQLGNPDPPAGRGIVGSGARSRRQVAVQSARPSSSAGCQKAKVRVARARRARRAWWARTGWQHVSVQWKGAVRAVKGGQRTGRRRRRLLRPQTISVLRPDSSATWIRPTSPHTYPAYSAIRIQLRPLQRPPTTMPGSASHLHRRKTNIQISQICVEVGSLLGGLHQPATGSHIVRRTYALGAHLRHLPASSANHVSPGSLGV